MWKNNTFLLQTRGKIDIISNFGDLMRENMIGLCICILYIIRFRLRVAGNALDEGKVFDNNILVLWIIQFIAVSLYRF